MNYMFMSVKTVVATEISKQIDEKAIKDLIIESFVGENSDFASSIKTFAYVNAKKLFDNDFFASVFTHAVNSGIIDTQIKDKVINRLKTICSNNKEHLTAISNVREVIMSAFIQLSTKEYNESAFWNEMRRLVKPEVNKPVRDDINKIMDYIDSDKEQMSFDISIRSTDVEKSLFEPKINEMIKEFFKQLTNDIKIASSIRKLHSDDILPCIETAYKNANGNTIKEKDEFEDDFDVEDNILESKVGRLREDIRSGFATSFIKYIGAKGKSDTPEKRLKYINAIVRNDDIIENIKNEMIRALNDSIQAVNDQIINNIREKISVCVNGIVKKYNNLITDVINNLLIGLCTTNGVKWNSHMLSLVVEPILNVIIENINNIIEKLTKLIIRNINTDPCKNMIKNKLISFNCESGNIPTIIKTYISRTIVNCRDSIEKIIDIEALEIKKMYNEAYKETPYETLCRLCTHGSLDERMDEEDDISIDLGED